jgi:PHD/YefM family antitoxin component YafN of YafNO toxin-antitoxin module
MVVTASALRTNIYKLLDQVAAGGEPLVIMRKGQRLRVVLEERPSKLSRLSCHDTIVGEPEELVHMDWSGEWSDDLP